MFNSYVIRIFLIMLSSLAAISQVSAQASFISRPVLVQAGSSQEKDLGRRTRIEDRKARVDLINTRDTNTAPKTGDVVFEGDGFYVREAFGSTYYVMAEARNIGSSTKTFVKVTIDLYDRYDNLIASDWTYIWGTCMTLTSIDMETDTCLKHNEVGFFGDYMEFSYSRLDYGRFTFEYGTSPVVVPDANVVISSGPTARDYYGDIKLNGTLRNNGLSDAKFVKIACALRDDTDGLLDIDFDYVDGSSIDGSSSGLHQGETGSFLMYTSAPTIYYRSTTSTTSWDDYGSVTPGCSLSLSPGSATLGASSHLAQIALTIPAGCAWTAESQASWISAVNPAQGSGPATITYRVGENTSTSQRSGTIRINDTLFAVTQQGSQSACTADQQHICLGDRFRVSAVYQTQDAPAASARAVKLTDDTGYLWFFDANNIEVVVKLLNGCSINQHYWVFAAGLTNVGVQLEVVDTAGQVSWNHTSPIGSAFAPVQDTIAFASCP